MAIGSGVPYNEHTGNGVTTVFAYGFTLLDADDLVVTIDDVVTSDYTVAGLGNPSGGSITMGAAPANGAAVLLLRDIQLVRTTDYQENGDLLADTLNPDFDRAWMALQQLDAKVGGAVRAPYPEQLDELPAAADRAGKLLSFDPVTGQPECVAAVDQSATQLAIDLASTAAGKGTELSGFDYSVLYSQLTAGWGIRTATVSTNILTGIDTSLWAGLAAGSYTTALDTQIQAKIDALTLVGGGELVFPGGYTYYFGTVTPKSNVTLRVMPGATLKQIQPVGSTQTGIYKASGSGSLSNFHITGGGLIDGQRVASPGNPFNHIVYIALGSGETLSDFSVVGMKLQDAQEDFIRITANHTTAQAEKIRVAFNNAVTTSGKRNLGGTSYTTAHDLIRIEQVYDYATSGNGYGNVHFRDILVYGNECESIRTCADLKRGCANFAVFGNNTKNMYDCHHSVDGSFDGVLLGNTMRVESSYSGTLLSGSNFIEVQGERIGVVNNTGDAGGKLGRGIFVTDYGRTEEGSSRGHVSKSVKLRGNTIYNVTSNGVEALNGNSCEAVGNTVDTATNYGVVFTSGGSRKASDGATDLTGTGCYVGQNTMRSTGLGCRLTVPNSVMGGGNIDENGEEFIYFPATLNLASTYAPWRRDHAHNELCPNRYLHITGAAWPNLDYFESAGAGTYPAITAASTRPNGTPAAVVLGDADAGNAITPRCATYIPATQNQRLYVRLHAGPNSSTSFSVLVQEWNGVSFLTNTFYGLSTPGAWTEYILHHKVSGATCTNVRILLVPAASSNNAAATGSTEFADLRISRQAPGVA